MNVNGSTIVDWLRSPRAALLANVALVMTGSVLALLALVDLVTGMIIVTIGFAGIVVSLLGQRSEPTTD